MSEIDVILIELERLLTELKDSRGNEELKGQIRRLFARVNPLVKEIDDVEEMERIIESAGRVAGMASYLLSEKEPELREFLRLLGIQGDEQE
jgi:hypothetical protein